MKAIKVLFLISLCECVIASQSQHLVSYDVPQFESEDFLLDSSREFLLHSLQNVQRKKVSCLQNLTMNETEWTQDPERKSTSRELRSQIEITKTGVMNASIAIHCINYAAKIIDFMLDTLSAMKVAAQTAGNDLLDDSVRTYYQTDYESHQKDLNDYKNQDFNGIPLFSEMATEIVVQIGKNSSIKERFIIPFGNIDLKACLESRIGDSSEEARKSQEIVVNTEQFVRKIGTKIGTIGQSLSKRIEFLKEKEFYYNMALAQNKNSNIIDAIKLKELNDQEQHLYALIKAHKHHNHHFHIPHKHHEHKDKYCHISDNEEKQWEMERCAEYGQPNQKKRHIKIVKVYK